jgi:hypothetical protein
MKVLNITYKFNETNVLSLNDRLEILEAKILEHNNNLDLVLCSEFYLCDNNKEGKIDYINSNIEAQIKSRLNNISQRYQNVIIMPGTTLCFDESYNCYFNKTYIYHNGFVTSYIKKYSAGLEDLVYNKELLLKDCFIEDRIVEGQGLDPKRKSRIYGLSSDKISKGYLTYITENYFILLQICADYCENYNGIHFNKYKLKINLSYGLRKHTNRILNNYDIIIKSDGDLGPECLIKNSSITIAYDNKINEDNIQIQVLLLNEAEKPKEELQEGTQDILFKNIYNINKDRHLDFNYFQNYLSGYKIDNVKTIFDQYNIFSINKNKRIINNIDDIYDIVLPADKFIDKTLTKEDLLGYIHCKYNIQNITDEEIYEAYTKDFLFKKYLKYKKKYLALKYNQK